MALENERANSQAVDEAELSSSIELGQIESCTRRLDTLLYCYSPPNQFGTYYNRGTIDPCMEAFNNLYSCLKLKTNMPSSEKREMISKMNQSGEHSPTRNVWEFRSDPADSWNKKT